MLNRVLRQIDEIKAKEQNKGENPRPQNQQNPTSSKKPPKPTLAQSNEDGYAGTAYNGVEGAYNSMGKRSPQHLEQLIFRFKEQPLWINAHLHISTPNQTETAA